jgi:predicted RNA-binding Zn ribbon-like protein
MTSAWDDVRGDGYGAVWPAFLATHRGRLRDHQDELLPDGAALTGFLAAHGLAPSRRVTDSDARRAQVLREAMYRVTSAEYNGRSCAAGDLRVVDDALQHGAPMHVGRSAGALRPRPPADVDEALARIVTELVSDLTGTRRSQLRSCGDDTCSGFFLDVSGRRRWCSSERCGTRMRVRAHRARAESAGTGH